MSKVELARAALACAEVEAEWVDAKAATQAEADQRAAAIADQLAKTTSIEDVWRLTAEIEDAQRPVRPPDELRARLKEARSIYREMRSATPPAPSEARPATIDSTSNTPSPGGN